METQGQETHAVELTQETELALMQQIQEGDRGAFTTLFNQLRQRVCHHAHTLLQSEADAEDIAQEVFATLYTKSDLFRGESAVSTWLYRVTVNTALSLKRYRQRRHTLSIEDLEKDVVQHWTGDETLGVGAFDEGLIKAEALRQLRQAIEALSPLDRAVVVLADLQGQSNRVTGESLGLSEAAVKSRRHRARLQLREQLTTPVSGPLPRPEVA